MSKIIFKEVSAAPATPDAGYAAIYALDDGSFNVKLSNGTVIPLTEVSSVTGWKDLRAALVGAAAGAGAPALAAFGPTGNIKQLSFGIGDSVYVACHVDHDIKVGSTMYPHVHWSTNGTSTNSVKWQLNYITAKGHNQQSFGVETVLTVEEAAHGTAWRHMITEDVTGFTALEVDSLVIIELKRITNGGTDNADTVFGLFVDLHYEVDKYASVNRLPPFYS